MPKSSDKGSKIIYPEQCRELSEDLSKEELLKRLKALAKAFQEMGQDDNCDYKELALFLATEFFMDHPNKDVRLLIACCIADMFRIFAPEAPYTDSEHLKDIFMFLTKQLKGLEDPNSPSFKRNFYLLENLAWVKSFNICIELEDNQEIFCDLFKLMFSIVNQGHSNKVLNFMLDMMSPLIAEADTVSQDLLDIILLHIIEPLKSTNKVAYGLARDLIKRTANALEPYMQTFFNNALMLGKTSESEVSERLFDLIYELNMIAPAVLLAVLPQLEFKLKSSDEKERRAVTTLLAKMFSDPDSQLAQQNKPLWICFLGRFKDIDTMVRRTCVQISQEFIVNHPDLVSDVTDCLKERGHDVDENVRMDVIQAIVSAGKRDFLAVTDDLFTCVKERTLDKKYKLRKEALSGLGAIYRRCTQRDDLSEEEISRIDWVKEKVLHAYYQTTVDDRILVERILNMSLVPFSLEPKPRMKRLLSLYCSIDENAIKAFQEILKTQMNLRAVLRSLCELHIRSEKEDVSTQIQARILALSRNLPEPQKAQEHMRTFSSMLRTDPRIRQTVLNLTAPDCKCSNTEEYVKEVQKKMGVAAPTNNLYTNVRTILERIAPVMVDKEAIVALVEYLDDAINGIQEINDDIKDVSSKGMKLLLLLSMVYPGAFQTQETYFKLISFIKHEDDSVSDVVLQIFANIGLHMEHEFPEVYSSLMPILQKMVKIGTPKQAKHAVHCISRVCKTMAAIFRQIFEHSQKHLDLESSNFLTSLVAIGHMTLLCPGEFAETVKTTISTFVVKDLLMQDRGQSQHSAESWYSDHLVSDETQAKMYALKLMVRWLLGIKSNEHNSGTSTLRLLYTIIVHEGDLMEKGLIDKPEMARLRLQAGCCMLKLAQEHVYEACMTLEWFQALSLLIVDPCYEVRYRFAEKLHKGLLSLRLPLQYMSIFCLAACDPLKERRQQSKGFLATNIAKRREYLRTNTNANAKMFSVLPDYVLPYAIHLLAHDPDLRDYQDVDGLKAIKECLWFIMEPLISKNESYSYSFYRKLIENIKQTKDKQNPSDAQTNAKLYAVCDLALGLVMTKSTAFILKDFPAEPVLPAKLFTSPDNTYSNTKIYLPEELRMFPSKTKKQPTPLNTSTASSAPVNESHNNKVRQTVVVSRPVLGVSGAGDATCFSPSSSPSGPSRVATSPQHSPTITVALRGLPAATTSNTSGSRVSTTAGNKRKASQENTNSEDSDDGGSEPKRQRGRTKRSPSPSAQAIGSRQRGATSSNNSSGGAKAQQASSSTQGKITDFVVRSAAATRNNKENKPTSDTGNRSAVIQQSARAGRTNNNRLAQNSEQPAGRASPGKRGASEDSNSVETSPVKKRLKQRQQEQESESEGETGSSPVKKPTAARAGRGRPANTRRGNQKTAEASESEEESVLSSPKKPVRGDNQTTAEASESEEESGLPAPKKPARRGTRSKDTDSDQESSMSSPRKGPQRRTIRKTTEDSESEDESEQSPSKRTTKRTTSRDSSVASPASVGSTGRRCRQTTASTKHPATRTNVRMGRRIHNGTSESDATPDTRRSSQTSAGSSQQSPARGRGRPPRSSQYSTPDLTSQRKSGRNTTGKKR